MATDWSKYGAPIEENTKNETTDWSQYGEPAIANPYVKPKPEGDTGLQGFATGVGKGILSTVKGLGQLGESAGRGILGGVQNLTGLPVKPDAKWSEDALEESSQKGGAMGKLFRSPNLKAKSNSETLGKIAEFVGEMILPVGQAKKGVDSAKTLSRLADTPATLTSLEEKLAALEGRVTKGVITGSKKILPSKTEERAANLLRGRISSDVTKNPKIIQDEIATRGREVENALSKAPKPITADEQLRAWTDKRKTIEKNLDKNQLKAFDEQFRMFLKQISDQGVVDTDTGKLYKAIKDYETNVASNLPRGKATLTDATGVASAKIQGAKAVRDIARKMIGSKHPEFQEKMFDLASLYDVLSTAITKSRQLEGGRIARFIKGHPVITGLGTTGATIGAGYLLGNKNANATQGFEDINR